MMLCPTCRARQEWSDACRRCKCDLRLLRQAAEQADVYRHSCLMNLRRGWHRQALADAHHAAALRDDDAIRPLLAACLLLNGRWEEAVALSAAADAAS